MSSCARKEDDRIRGDQCAGGLSIHIERDNVLDVALAVDAKALFARAGGMAEIDSGGADDLAKYCAVQASRQIGDAGKNVRPQRRVGSRVIDLIQQSFGN